MRNQSHSTKSGGSENWGPKTSPNRSQGLIFSGANQSAPEKKAKSKDASRQIPCEALVQTEKPYDRMAFRQEVRHL